MTRLHQWIGLAVLSAAMTGCVSQDQYSALKLDRDRLAEQLVASQRDSSSAAAQANAYKSQYEGLLANGGTNTALVTNLTQQKDALQAQLDDLNRRYSEELNKPRVAGTSALPPKLTDELNAFAQANPDLVDFDSARGIVKFKSDVTFGVGDASLTAGAKGAIDRFAKILSGPNASSYELLVAGHTDNTPVHNPATINAGHKDNWYLSSHRAIAVGSELVKTGVSATRIGVVGYADQRPVASNASESGKAQNRRVEVLILPTTVRINTNNAVTAGSRSGPAVKAGVSGGARTHLGKDANVAAPTGPTFGK